MAQSVCVCSNLLNLLPHHNWIIAPNLLLAMRPVVERALVLVTVSMHRAEQAPATTLETCKRTRELWAH